MTPTKTTPHMTPQSLSQSNKSAAGCALLLAVLAWLIFAFFALAGWELPAALCGLLGFPAAYLLGWLTGEFITRANTLNALSRPRGTDKDILQ